MVIDTSALVAVLLAEPGIREARGRDRLDAQLPTAPAEASGHRVLNFGDCLPYGVGIATGEQLLFVRRDFVSTDVPAAPS